MRHKDWLSWLPTAAVGLVLVLAPLPFGGVVPRAAAWLDAAGFVLLALALLWGPRAPSAREPAALGLAWPALALAGLSLWGLVQSLPLPARVVELVAPEQMRLRSELASALPLEVAPPPPALSVAPEVSRGVALHWASLAALWGAATLLGRRRGHRRVLALALAAAVALELTLAFRGWMAGSKLIWGTMVSSDSQRLHGTFVNPNHFALYLEIALALALAWLWWSWRRARGLPELEHRVMLAGPALIVWLGLFVCVAFTGSRAGLLAAVGGVLVQATALWLLSRRRLRSAVALGGLAAAGLVAVAWVGWRQGFGRWWTLSSSAGLSSRIEVYSAAWELWQRFPFFGTGLGTFRESFGLVQPATVPGSWWHAHSDWLELAVTGGAVAVILAGIGGFALVRRLGMVFRYGRRSEDRAAALAAFGALGAAAIHEWVDFGLTMPANAVTLMVVLAAATGAAIELPSQPTDRRDDPPEI